MLNQKWTYHSTLTSVRDFSVAITMKDGVYIFGGWSNPLTSDFLPNGSKNWMKGPEIPKDLKYNCGEYDEFCVIAGHKISNEDLVRVGLGQHHEIAAKYNINTKKWERTTLLIPRHGHSCNYLNGKIIISGGYAWKPIPGQQCQFSQMYFVDTEIICPNTWMSRRVDDSTFNEDFQCGGRPLRSGWTRATHGTALMTIGNRIRLIAFGGSIIDTDTRSGISNYGTKLFLDSCKLWDEETAKWVDSDLKLSQGRKEIRYLSIPYLERHK